MSCYQSSDTRKYLYAFYQILNTMEDKMLNVPITDNITINFIRAMIPHHQAAIYMCENLLRFTNDRDLEQVARNIINTQTKGIANMREVAMTTNRIFKYKKRCNII